MDYIRRSMFQYPPKKTWPLISSKVGYFGCPIQDAFTRQFRSKQFYDEFDEHLIHPVQQMSLPIT